MVRATADSVKKLVPTDISDLTKWIISRPLHIYNIPTNIKANNF
jgi:hypothetical protein